MAKKIVVRVKGKQHTYTSVAKAAKAAGMNYSTFYMRLVKGVRASTAFRQPVRKYEQASA